MTEPDPFAEAKELREQQRKEYGTYVAVTAIDILGARAFNPGDPVPVSHVEGNVVASTQVARTTTKAAAAAIEKG
jgi:hypothetical protein